MNRLVVAGSIVALLMVGGCALEEPGAREARQATGSTGSTVESGPHITYTKSCDMLLGGWNDPTWFVAQAVLKNSGDADGVAEVVGTWVQVGSRPLRDEARVTVPAGGRKVVNLKVKGGSHEVDAYQAGYSGGGPECRVVAHTLG